MTTSSQVSWAGISLLWKYTKMDQNEKLRRSLAELEKRAEHLEKRYDRLVGKVDEFAPRILSTMREGLPLEFFTRSALLESEFQVFGVYPFEYFNREREVIERSVDIYAVKDSIYTVPEGRGRISGRSWAERNHLLVEVKQRRPGVEWIFCTLPKSNEDFNMAGEKAVSANSGFEIRPNETGLTSSANTKDVNNAIAQLNQSYMPFQVGLHKKDTLQFPGSSWQYASSNGKDQIWLLLITNAKIRHFVPPFSFADLAVNAEQETELFKEVPWIMFQPERSISLQFHQKEFLRRSNLIIDDSVERAVLQMQSEVSHQVHIVNYDHLSEFLQLVRDPPRLEKIQLSVSVNGEQQNDFTIE